jgi:membrane protein
VDALQLEPVLDALVALDWIARMNELEDHAATRFVLLVDPAVTPLEPLTRLLLLPYAEATRKVWEAGALRGLRLADVL